MSKIIPIKVETKSTQEIAHGELDHHVEMAKTFSKMLENQRRRPQKNLTSVPIHQATRNSRVALVTAPMWGPQIAPYGIARLAGLARHAGFKTKCWDVNIECYDATKGELWSHWWDWKWNSPELYEKEIQPIILPTLEKFLDELVEFNPTMIGFTTYYTNINCVTWMLRQIKQRLPNARIIAGGPQARRLNEYSDALFDHIVRGEGEMIFLNLLENIENNEPPLAKYLDHDKSIRIDLDSLPIPDYRDFNIDLYQFKGVAGEVSRGCIAKCTFCSETTFWRYRGRIAENILDEVEFNYKTYGISTVWFIDSLVNGNLKELLTFAQGLIDRNIKVNWLGFTRNDGRMNKEYLNTLLKSGCMTMHIGIESGSQKVLDLIQKKVKVAEIEQNFNDLAELNHFGSGTSWFVGFPGEEPVDIAQTLTLVWRLRNAGLNTKGFVMCALDPDSPITTQPERFGISPGLFGGKWFTTDWRNTIAHRIIRYKAVYVLLNHYREHRVRPNLQGVGGRNEFLTHHTLEYDVDQWVEKIPYELDFDFNIIKTDINPLADSLVNEIWPIFRVLWLAMGPFTLEVKFDPEIDYPLYGDFRYFQTGTGKLWANYKFTIDETGNWSADFYTKLDAVYEDNVDRNFEHTWSGTGHWTRVLDN
jgi:anaerobic magnesium-protoporphyrin IX monomethyl ester cyclase